MPAVVFNVCAFTLNSLGSECIVVYVNKGKRQLVLCTVYITTGV